MNTMKFGLPLVILILAVLASILSVTFLFGFDPKQEASAFIEAVQSGNLGRTARHFGMICVCPVRGGWGSYLVYQSGEEPNLAFLMGHHFRTEQNNLVSLWQATTPSLPWRRAEEADVNLTLEFPKEDYRPMLLPLPLAYGKDMRFKDFQHFINHPAEGLGQGMTLRLRSGLQPGSIKPNVESIDPQERPQFKALDGESNALKSKDPRLNNKSDQTSQAGKLLTEALKHQNTPYLIPKEAGNVIGEDGKPIAIEAVEKKLPRLRSAILILHVVRSGPWQNWAVFRFAFTRPIFSQDDDTKIVDLTTTPPKKPHYEP
jgi:hypothetical protein